MEILDRIEEQSQSPDAPAPTALLVVFGLAMSVAGFVAIGSWLAIEQLYGGFIFLLYWITAHQAKIDSVLPIILGSGLID